ncbi:hypothetical protein VTJ04DRAFT_4779 [Mycothermus thermophilus]|uniref:uncharacterized protein n=1 Tax=Humicola insolens TaxID=85995 RepID=UPI0037435AC5
MQVSTGNGGKVCDKSPLHIYVPIRTSTTNLEASHAAWSGVCCHAVSKPPGRGMSALAARLFSVNVPLVRHLSGPETHDRALDPSILAPSRTIPTLAHPCFPSRPNA